MRSAPTSEDGRELEVGNSAWGLVGSNGIRVQHSEPASKVDGAGAAPILVIGSTRGPRRTSGR